MLEQIKQALAILAEKVNKLAERIKAKPDVYFGTVDTVSGDIANVVLDGDTDPVETTLECSARAGSRVTVIRKGTSLVTVSSKETQGAACFLGALVQIRQGLFQLDIYNAYPSNFQTGTLIAAYCYAANSYAGKINIGLTHATGGALYVHGAESSASNPITWGQGDVLLLSYRGGTTPYFIVVSKF